MNRLRQALAVIRDVGDTAELDKALAEELSQNTERCVQSLHLDVRGPPGRISPEELLTSGPTHQEGRQQKPRPRPRLST